MHIAAIDGCHIPICCLPGGAEEAKEFHNFKNFYSIVLMAFIRLFLETMQNYLKNLISVLIYRANSYLLYI